MKMEKKKLIWGYLCTMFLAGTRFVALFIN